MGHDQATGLAFSVNQQTAIPPSLRNILKEWRAEFGVVEMPSGDLTPWARRGVLLMNRVLVRSPWRSGQSSKPRMGTIHGFGDHAVGRRYSLPSVLFVGE